MRVLIAGAGIGGLVTAMSLHQQDIEVEVFEASARIQPLGLGINLLPHAVTVLRDLDLLEQLRGSAVETAALRFYNTHGQLIWQEPRGVAAGYQVPQLSIHRGELQMLLLAEATKRLGESAIHLGSQVLDHRCQPGSVSVTLASQAQHAGDALIAADGIHSRLRAQLHPGEGMPSWSGNVLWRGLVRAPSYLGGRTMIMAGHRPHKFVAYPISAPDEDGRQLINWIAELDRSQTPLEGRENWNRLADASEFADRFDGWRFPWLDVPELIAATGQILVFPMVDRDPLPFWGCDRMTLVGDAAHPMYPIGSNGASQAILDATCLTRQLKGAASSDAASALRRYEQERLPATAAIVHSNRASGPEVVMDLAHQRAPNGFRDVAGVFTDGELEGISTQYKQVAGLVPR